LIAHTGNGPVSFTKPLAFQENDQGERVTIAVAYQLVGVDSAAPHGMAPSDAKSSPTVAAATYAFALGNYDANRTLIIDPLLQSTYHGGDGSEIALAIAIHPTTGEVYVAGFTFSTNLPGTSTATGGIATGAQSIATGNLDAYISRFNATLTTRLQSTYLGGNGPDSARAIAIHPTTGEVYIAGETGSTDLPGTATPSAGAQPTYGQGALDAFVSRFNAALTTRPQSTYLGGSGLDYGRALAIHPATGEVYVAGYTNSSNFPGTATPSAGAQPISGGGYDAFVSRLNATLTSLVQSTYLGGNGSDEALALAIHPATGEAYVAGHTTSQNFPGTTTPSAGAQPSFGGGTYDTFISRFNAALTTRLQSTYLGGNFSDYATSIAIHPSSGEVYVAGYTESNPFPGTGGPIAGAQATYGGGSYDAFVSRLNAALTTRLQSTYVGGSGIDFGNALAIHPSTGEVYVAGRTDSSNFPGSAPPTAGAQPTYGGGSHDAFVSRLNAALTTRLQSTYLGGNGNDSALTLAIHSATGEVYVAGETTLSDLPGTANGAQTASGGNFDAFLSRFSPDLTVVNRIPNPFSFIHQSHVPPNTTRTSNEVRLIITPNPGNNQQSAYVTGETNSEFCVANQSGICVKPYVGCGSPCFGTGWLTASNPPYQFLSGDYVAVSHTSAASGTAETKLIVSGVAYPFRSSTGNANVVCNLDMNGDNQVSATVEGLILVRAMLGLGADAIIAGTGVNAWDPIRVRLNEFCGTTFPFSPSAFQ
jgi:hypothetical protein